MRILILGILLCLTHWAFGQSETPNEKLYSAEALRADLQFYKKKVEQYHPNLYLYTSKEGIDRFFDSLNMLVNKPLTVLEFYSIITLTSAVVKDGHTLLLPNAATTDLYNQKSKFLPYQLSLIDGNLYVQMVCTQNTTIPAGAKIIKINGVSSADILQQLMARQVRDGNNMSYPRWIIKNYFREYYSYIYGHPDRFTIQYVEGDKILEADIAALPKETIYQLRAENYPTINLDKQVNGGLTLQFDPQNNQYAILTIKDFHNDILKSAYKQKFKPTVSNFFRQIEAHKTPHLILDLRNNQGGDIANGVHLLSFLLQNPFKVVTGYNCLKNGQLKPCKGPSSGWHQPNRHAFKGDLYVLLNGGSFSNSSIVASCLKQNSKALFIGEETGGNPHILGGFAKEFELPNTRISVEIPTKQFVLTSKEQNVGTGLKPDYTIVPSITEELQQVDPALDFILNLIAKNNN